MQWLGLDDDEYVLLNAIIFSANRPEMQELSHVEALLS